MTPPHPPRRPSNGGIHGKKGKPIPGRKGNPLQKGNRPNGGLSPADRTEIIRRRIELNQHRYARILSENSDITTHQLISRLGHSWTFARQILQFLGETQRVADYDAYIEMTKKNRKGKPPQ